MRTSIEIIQLENDNADYLKLIVELLNQRFTTQESMELRWQLNCLDVAQELGGKLIAIPPAQVIFDFTERFGTYDS